MFELKLIRKLKVFGQETNMSNIHKLQFLAFSEVISIHTGQSLLKLVKNNNGWLARILDSRFVNLYLQELGFEQKLTDDDVYSIISSNLNSRPINELFVLSIIKTMFTEDEMSQLFQHFDLVSLIETAKSFLDLWHTVVNYDISKREVNFSMVSEDYEQKLEFIVEFDEEVKSIDVLFLKQIDDNRIQVLDQDWQEGLSDEFVQFMDEFREIDALFFPDIVYQYENYPVEYGYTSPYFGWNRSYFDLKDTNPTTLFSILKLLYVNYGFRIISKVDVDLDI